MKKVKVALCMPYYKGRNHSPFLGVGYISSSLESIGVETRIFDLDAIAWVMKIKYEKDYYNEMLKYFGDKLTEFEPDIIGISINTTNYEEALDLLKYINNIKGKAKIVCGGPHISTSYNTINKYHSELFDLLIVGEGEIAFLNLCNDIKNLEFEKKYISKKIVFSETIDSIDSLPFPDRKGFYKIFDDSDLTLVEEHYRRNFYTHLPGFKNKKYERIVASRGCDYSCSFCSPSVYWSDSNTKLPKRRIRDPKRIVDEIEELYSDGIEAFYFDDPTFPIKSDMNFFNGFITEIKKRNLKISWASPIRIQEIDTTVISDLKDSGFTYTYYGLETINNNYLQDFNKDMNIKESIATMKMLIDNGIHCDISYQIGLPGEKIEDVYNAIDWLASNGLTKNAFFSITAIWPETYLAKQYGITSDDFEPHIDKAINEKSGLYFFKTGNKEVEDFYSNCSGTYHFVDEEFAIKVKNYLISSDFFNRFKRLGKDNV